MIKKTVKQIALIFGLNKSYRPKLINRSFITSFIILIISILMMFLILNKLYNTLLVKSFIDSLRNQTPIFLQKVIDGKYYDSLEDVVETNKIKPLKTIKRIICIDNHADKKFSTGTIYELCDNFYLNKLKLNQPSGVLLKIKDHTIIALGYRFKRKINNKKLTENYAIFYTDAANYQKTQLHNQREVFALLIVFLIVATIFLLLSNYWSFIPIRKITDELQLLFDSKIKKLSSSYPADLLELTKTINTLIEINSSRQKNYTNALDDLAHSLKTRLAAMYAIIESDMTSGNEQSELNKKLLEQLSQIDELISYQLRKARLGQKSLQTEYTRLYPVLLSITKTLEKIHNHKNIKISLELSKTFTLPISQMDLMELMGNLIENAFKFANKHILITAERADNRFKITVEDDGPGVNKEHREAIFQRGVRADRLNPGQGIGLSVCHDIVLSYNGQINIKTSQLQGACFYITFDIIQ